MKSNRPFIISVLAISLIAIATGCDRAPTTTPDTNDQATAPAAVTPDPNAADDTAPTPNAGQVGDTEAAMSAQSAVAEDRTIIPGERVGPITSTTSRADLAEIYGEGVLNDQPIPMGEGTTEPGTVVELGPEDHFSVVWADDSQTEPLLVKDFGPAWQTPEGLGVGVPYDKLESELGNFKLYGFAWDYQGSLDLQGSQLDKYHGNLLLRVSPSETAMKEHADAYQAVMGDTLYESNNPNLDPLELSVYEMTVYLNPLTGEG
jgi:hypothetical protein